MKHVSELQFASLSPVPGQSRPAVADIATFEDALAGGVQETTPSAPEGYRFRLDFEEFPDFLESDDD